MKGRRMHGFMCHPQASTAVCIPGDTRSVVVPRRPDRTLVDGGATKAIDFKYSRLGADPRRLAADPDKRLQVITLPLAAAAGEKRLQVMAVPTRNKAATEAAIVIGNAETAKAGNAPPASDDPPFQVVVMRVSIHCQGCAGKVKKLISKMEGVTSFTIDVEAKRVTVMGHISPVDVLESISKVKRAEFWPTSAPAKTSLKAEPASFSHSQGAIPSTIPQEACAEINARN